MTYRELQIALKEFKAQGLDVTCKLNAKKDVLQAEYDHIMGAKQSTEEIEEYKEEITEQEELEALELTGFLETVNQESLDNLTPDPYPATYVNPENYMLIVCMIPLILVVGFVALCVFGTFWLMTSGLQYLKSKLDVPDTKTYDLEAIRLKVAQLL